MGQKSVKGSTVLIRNLILAGMALFAGGVIYVLLRTSEPLFFHWADRLGIGGILMQLRNSGGLSENELPSWFNYSLPDGLWAFAFSLIMTSVWSGTHARIRNFWMASIPVFILGFEFTQMLGSVPGIFCLVDIAFCSTGVVLGMLLGDTKLKETQNENALI